jgi:hypothetical protein
MGERFGFWTNEEKMFNIIPKKHPVRFKSGRLK